MIKKNRYELTASDFPMVIAGSEVLYFNEKRSLWSVKIVKHLGFDGTIAEDGDGDEEGYDKGFTLTSNTDELGWFQEACYYESYGVEWLLPGDPIPSIEDSLKNLQAFRDETIEEEVVLPNP